MSLSGPTLGPEGRKLISDPYDLNLSAECDELLRYLSTHSHGSVLTWACVCMFVCALCIDMWSAYYGVGFYASLSRSFVTTGFDSQPTVCTLSSGVLFFKICTRFSPNLKASGLVRFGVGAEARAQIWTVFSLRKITDFRSSASTHPSPFHHTGFRNRLSYAFGEPPLSSKEMCCGPPKSRLLSFITRYFYSHRRYLSPNPPPLTTHPPPPCPRLLLVFRTNASYERWDGARKMIGLVKNRSEARGGICKRRWGDEEQRRGSFFPPPHNEHPNSCFADDSSPKSICVSLPLKILNQKIVFFLATNQPIHFWRVPALQL